jgi:hypothetical protein
MTLAALLDRERGFLLQGLDAAPSEIPRHDQDALLRFQTFDHLRAGLPVNVGSGEGSKYRAAFEDVFTQLVGEFLWRQRVRPSKDIAEFIRKTERCRRLNFERHHILRVAELKGLTA